MAARAHRYPRAPAGWRVETVTPSRWKDVEALFGERGACAGCWCMCWRLPNREWEAGKGAGNRRAFRALVESGAKPGVLGYVGRTPAAWCAVAPRADYGYLARSRILKSVDAEPVWSISCLFIDRAHRRRGLSRRMIEAAVGLARDRGARVVEAYPVEPRTAAAPDAFLWTGIASAYLAAGFREVARRSETRPILRRAVRPRRGSR